MPEYRWLCLNCDNEVEVKRKMDNYDMAPSVPCEKCDKTDWRKLMSKSSIQGNLQKGNYNSGS